MNLGKVTKFKVLGNNSFVYLSCKFYSTSYKLKEVKKEISIFEKLLHIGMYETEKIWNKNLVCKYRTYLEENFENIKSLLITRNSTNKYEEYAFERIQNNKHEDLLIADVLYENKKNILCIGDGNLSFSSLLQKKLNLSKIVATSVESKSDLITSYGNIFKKNLKKLEANGGIYIPSINLEEMKNHFMHNTFDVIVFNFPFVIPTQEFIHKKWNVNKYSKLNEIKNVKTNEEDEQKEKMNIHYIKYYKKSEHFLLNKMFYHLFKISALYLKAKGYLHLRLTDKFLNCHFPSDLSLSFIQKIDFFNSSIYYKTLKYIPSTFNYNIEQKIHNAKQKKNVIFTTNGTIIKSFKMKHTSTLVFQKEI